MEKGWSQSKHMVNIHVVSASVERSREEFNLYTTKVVSHVNLKNAVESKRNFTLTSSAADVRA